jgi:4-amino-4-deoxy-L-arabinose transferase-like glycosyltransferase
MSQAGRRGRLTRQEWIGILALLGLAALLRFYHLGDKGLWGDEIFEVKRAFRSLETLWAFRQGDAFLFHFALVKLATLGGRNEFWYRLPSAFLSVLCVPVAYGMGRRMFGPAAGLVAMLCVAVAPYQIWYAQEARMYSAQCFFAALSLFFFIRLLQAPALRWTLGLAAANTLGIYNHLFAVFPVATEIIALAAFSALDFYRARRQRRAWNAQVVKHVAAGLALTSVLVLPLTPATGSFILKQSQDAVVFASAAHPKMNWAFLQEWLTMYGLGASWGWRAFSVMGLAVVGLASLARRRPRFAWLAGLWLGLPFIVLYIVNPSYDLVQRYLIFTQPVYLALTAGGIVILIHRVRELMQRRLGEAPQSGLRFAWWLVLVALALWFLVLVVPALRALYGRAKLNDWRSLAEYVIARAEPGDVVMSESGTWAAGSVEFYLPNLLTYSTPRQNLDLEHAVSQGRRVWYISLGGLYDHNVEQWAEQNLGLVDAVAWQRPDLVYQARDEFNFPQAESPVKLYRHDAEIPSRIVYADRGAVGTGETNILVKPREVLKAKLKLDGKALRQLRIEWSPDEQAARRAHFRVLADNEPLTPGERKQDAGWKVDEFSLPTLPAEVIVQIENVGNISLRIHSLEIEAR